jgi:hypothetical protein
LDFHFNFEKPGNIDPWHLDLKRTIAQMLQAKKDISASSMDDYAWDVFTKLQEAYSMGIAFRTTKTKLAGAFPFLERWSSFQQTYVCVYYILT